jgi:hypothetical protein
MNLKSGKTHNMAIMVVLGQNAILMELPQGATKYIIEKIITSPQVRIMSHVKISFGLLVHQFWFQNILTTFFLFVQFDMFVSST